MKRTTASVVLVRVMIFGIALAVAASFSTGARADDLQAAMERNNTEWLDAYNRKDAKALGKMYKANAVLIGLTNEPIRGADQIEAYWVKSVAKCKDHTWTIMETGMDQTLAYQIAEWTLTCAGDKGDATYSGNTVRLLELQPDGVWTTKVHGVTRHKK